MVSQDEIHRMANSRDAEERREAVEQLRKNFADFPDEKQAWDDLIRLTFDTYNSWRAADALSSVISLMLDKNQAWDDLINLTSANHIDVRGRAAFALGRAFAYMADKNQAWDILHRLTSNNHSEVRGGAASAIGDAFLHVPNKNQAWNDLIRLTSDADRSVLIRAASALKSSFLHIPDKKQAWDDLIRLASDHDSDVSRGAASAIGIGFSFMPDKNQAWEELHRLTSDNFIYVRDGATSALGIAFLHIPDKNKAWEDLHRLSSDYHNLVRISTAHALGIAFSHIPDKQQAWDDLIRLASDHDSDVRWHAVDALGSAFQHVTDKEQATKDLLELTKDENNDVRRSAADALGSVFPHITNKKDALGALFILSDEKDREVRISTNHSLGRIFIYKATLTDSKEGFRKELEKALEFFEKASIESTYYNPTSFCLPFYRSFHAITSGKKEAYTDVNKYLEEAKNAVGGSESKEKLLEAVKNLSEALKETKIDKEKDFSSIKFELNAYRRYCERTAELLETTVENAPIATKLLGKVAPIIGEQISKKIEIQEKAEAIFEKTKGTPLESLGLELHEDANKLSQLTGLAFESGFDRLIKTVYKFCEYLPETENKKCNRICDTINLFANEKQDDVAKTLDSFLDTNYPKIRLIPISDRKKDVIRIINIQIDFELLTDTFPPNIKDEDKIRDKVFNALEKAKHEDADIVCLPELCVNENWLPDMKSQFNGMFIIPGTCYDKENHNICQLVLEHSGDIQPQLKFNPSSFEDSRVMEGRMKSGEKLINIYETQFGKIAILICRDFGNFIHFLRGIVDIVFVPSYNKANERFHKDADNHVTNSPSYVILSNTALYGGTSIFGQFDYNHFNTLEQKGCKKKGDRSYKLCEIEKGTEGMIIAEFNIANKSPQKQTPIASEEEIICVGNIKKIAL